MTEPKRLSPEEKALWRKHPATLPSGFDRVWATLDAAEAEAAALREQVRVLREALASVLEFFPSNHVLEGLEPVTTPSGWRGRPVQPSALLRYYDIRDARAALAATEERP